MRVSLTARFLSHPSIAFAGARHRAPRRVLGLSHETTTYHRPRAARLATPTVTALRCQTSSYRFPSVGGGTRAYLRRTALPLGLQRARRG